MRYKDNPLYKDAPPLEGVSKRRLTKALLEYVDWVARVERRMVCPSELATQAWRIMREDPTVGAKRPESASYRGTYRRNHGDIPPGHDVHHRDGDPFNDDPANLIALTPEEHRAAHRRMRRKRDIGT